MGGGGMELEEMRKEEQWSVCKINEKMLFK